MTLKRESAQRLAEACARRAGAALATLLDRKLEPEVPPIETAAAGRLVLQAPDEDPMAAVLAELEGAVVGRVALLVPQTATRDAVMSLVERRGPRRRRGLGYELLAASALLEMGNIVFSAAANALAEGIGGRVFPSVPRFSDEPAHELMQGWPAQSDALIAHLTLVGGSDSLRIRLVWLPDLASWD